MKYLLIKECLGVASGRKYSIGVVVRPHSASPILLQSFPGGNSVFHSQVSSKIKDESVNV